MSFLAWIAIAVAGGFTAAIALMVWVLSRSSEPYDFQKYDSPPMNEPGFRRPPV